eukprot:scaffold40971_cov52-Attheya_sp.AAC.2
MGNFIDLVKAFDMVDHEEQMLLKILERYGVPQQSDAQGNKETLHGHNRGSKNRKGKERNQIQSRSQTGRHYGPCPIHISDEHLRRDSEKKTGTWKCYNTNGFLNQNKAGIREANF